MEDRVLDKPYRPSPKNPGIIGYLMGFAVVALVGWFVADWYAWEVAPWLLGAGLLAFSIITVIRFYRNRSRRPFHYFYFLGKNALFIAIFLGFLNFPGYEIALWTAVGCFAAGMVAPAWFRAGKEED